jgi:hypothetical protein
MYSTVSLAETRSDSVYCLNDSEIKKISEAIQSLKFCETSLERLKQVKEANHEILSPNITVYETDDLIISFTVGAFFGIIVYNETERIYKRWDK